MYEILEKIYNMCDGRPLVFESEDPTWEPFMEELTNKEYIHEIPSKQHEMYELTPKGITHFLALAK